ncbi:MAG: GerMN domain-containing protein [Oscillospiraceae bacterium]|nr:GerMN domain-containing protein [Oscillospiraceae bacterium]
MRRTLCLLLALALLAGCGSRGLVRNESIVNFYYLSENPDYFSDPGILGAESRTLRQDQNSIEGLMAAYLRGPMTQGLTDPFPPDLRLVRAEKDDWEITLVFDDRLAEQTGIGLQLICACIARTVSEFDGGVDTVHIRAESLPLEGDREMISIQPGELILADPSAGETRTPVMLYFSDPDGRYLTGEPDHLPDGETVNPRDYIVERLIEGPASGELRPTIPEGTRLLGTFIANRVCVVNFSEEFLSNRPRSALEERMTVYSVVDSLTQLDEVDAVDIRVDGRKLDRYLYLDLSGELQPDERMIDQPGSGRAGTDASLYVCLEGVEGLAAYPVRIRDSEGIRTVRAVMDALCGFAECNGCYSPAKLLVREHDEQLEDGVLRVMLTVDPLSGEQLRPLIRSVTATLRELPEVRTIRLFINGEEFIGESDAEQSDWFLP